MNKGVSIKKFFLKVYRKLHNIYIKEVKRGKCADINDNEIYN